MAVYFYIRDFLFLDGLPSPRLMESHLPQDMERVMKSGYENALILNLKKGKSKTMLFGTSKNLGIKINP